MNFQTQPVQVLAPNIESVVMPQTDTDMDMATRISGGGMLDPAIAAYFNLQACEVNYLQLKQPDGKPFMDVNTDTGMKRFYVFALPKEPGSTEYHDDPAYMVALQCSITQPARNVFSIMPKKLFRGPEAYFVMSASFACCGAGTAPARVMLYSDNSQSKGPFLNRAFSGNGLRPEIRNVWMQLQTTVVDGFGGQALRHLALDLTGGGCKGHGHLVNPAKSGHWKGQTLAL